jgi:hypothetical protein
MLRSLLSYYLQRERWVKVRWVKVGDNCLWDAICRLQALYIHQHEWDCLWLCRPMCELCVSVLCRSHTSDFHVLTQEASLCSKTNMWSIRMQFTALTERRRNVKKDNDTDKEETEWDSNMKTLKARHISTDFSASRNLLSEKNHAA